MCGHVKYLKTTMYGMVGYMPDYSMVVVGANKGLHERDMTIEHLIIARILKIPTFFVVTKIDTPEGIAHYETTLEMIQAYVNSSRNNPDPVKPVPEVIDRDANLDTKDMERMAQACSDKTIIPIFPVSNVNGSGIELLRKFLSLIKSRAGSTKDFGKISDPPHVLIEEFYRVRRVEGLIAAGTVLSGQITVGTELLIGPNNLGQFDPVEITGIHIRNTDFDKVVAG